MKIATCKYSRHKMKLADNGYCCFCGPQTLETLDHIYLECPVTNIFLEKLSHFIANNIEQGYTDDHMILHLTCYHANTTVNFLNLLANWYIGRKFQMGKPLFWDEFVKYLGQFLIGEKRQTKQALVNVVGIN